MDERIHLNGEIASVADLRPLVQTNYGHFSAMRVESGGIRGLDRHLDRLVQATHELFGSVLDRDRVRAYLRRAIGDYEHALSLRINVFSRALNREQPDQPAAVDVLIMVHRAAAPSIAAAPLRLKSFQYARDLAQIKHVGTFPLFHYRRLARQDGFDDAVFTDADGRISEASVWNIGFVHADGVVWPDAPHLAGVSMQLLQAGLAAGGRLTRTRSIRLRDLAQYRAAFLCNASTPVRAVGSIDEHEFSADPASLAMLQKYYETNPLQRP